MSSAYPLSVMVSPPMLIPQLMLLNVSIRMTISAMQNKTADARSPCLTPRRMSMSLVVPISVLIRALDVSYNFESKFIYAGLMSVNFRSASHSFSCMIESNAFV